MAFLDSLKSLLAGTPKLNVSTRFALLREAISGTMSSFYVARDLQTNQVVGLKILDPQKTAVFEARFKGLKKPVEGEIAMQLKHPRIIETFEHGLTTEGAQYLVMELLEGPDFNSMIIAKHPALAERLARFIRQAAEAVAAVHAAGFLHRDVCPRNFMLTDKGQNLKLIDFGLTVPATPPFLLPGNRTGTPNYMAPELVRRKPTDQRVDVFAFGVSAYEMCAGTLPWLRGTTGMAAMSHDQPPADLRRHCPQLDPQLAAAIHACIEPEAHRRCPSMEKFLAAMKDVRREDGKG
jgi:serine/threonine-protein kinase